MRKNENAGGGYLKNLKNPLPLLLAFSLVSCHPAPAIAAEPVVFCSSPATQQREFPRAFPVASPPVAGYAGNPHPHGETGWQTRYTQRTTAQAVFLCVPYSHVRVMAGCMGASKDAPVLSAGLPTPYSPATMTAWQLLVVGNTQHSGVTTMTTPARIPSAARQRSIKITALILLSLKTGSKTGTVELQQRIAREGIPVSLRSVQRQLNLLSTVLPIEGDGNSPQGWRWKADTAATVARVAGGAA